MSDPRTSLSRGAVVGLKSVEYSSILTTFPLTKTTPGQDRTMNIRGIGAIIGQDPIAAGQILIHQYSDNGDRLAEVYIAVSIDGIIEWKPADLSSTTVFG